MYSHIMKGFTLGHCVARQILRNITGVPGLIIDLLVATLWVPHYKDYWEDTAIMFLDGTRVGRMQGVTGWVGEILGYIIGGVVGTLIGAVSYIPDAILRGLCWVHDQVSESINKMAEGVGTHTLFRSFLGVNQPENFIEKSWNLAVAVVGLPLAIALSTPPKIVEFFLPFMGHTISDMAWRMGGFFGGCLAIAVPVALYPAAYITSKCVDLYRGFRDSVRSISAFIYAKSCEIPQQQNNGCCLPDEAMHSKQFREKVAKYSNTSTAQILFGVKKAGKKNNLNDENDPRLCPISQEIMQEPVIDQHGHTFDKKNLQTWFTKQHTCPISREPLREDQLYPNRALEEIIKNPSVLRV